MDSNYITNTIVREESYVESCQFVKRLASVIEHGTFHHHFHIIWPLLENMNAKAYMEIGCYSGASLITALQCKTLRHALSVDTFVVWPDQEKTVRSNLQKFATSATAKVELISGSSHDVSLIAKLYHSLFSDPSFFGLDLLFIDGDQSLRGVMDDFHYFEALVRPGGMIVIDDYADAQYSPEVREAVDTICATRQSRYEMHGQPENRTDAFGNGITGTLSNEFIMQRKSLPIGLSSARYIVCIATYCRANGVTKDSLQRLLCQLNEQTQTDWFAIVIGDNYTNTEEFSAYAKYLPSEKSIFINLPVAGERENNVFSSEARKLWCNAGATAMNYALMLCQTCAPNGVIVHADDDDTWSPNHLQTIDDVYQQHTDASFVGTLGMYAGVPFPRNIEPVQRQHGEPVAAVQFMPKPGDSLHSSVSWRIKDIPLRYTVGSGPADAHMWSRMAEFMTAANLKSYLAKHLTMAHPTEDWK